MTPLVSLNQIQITMGSKLLFEELSLGFFENEKVGLIGPNGAGKSTLLKIIAGLEKQDSGDVNVRKSLNISYLPQKTDFDDTKNITEHIVSHLKKRYKMDEMEAEVHAAINLSIAGFENLQQPISELSGGWRKRLAIATCMAEDPDLFILDEPTNHMDWDGILWLEDWLKDFRKAFILVSHDRVFLNALTNRTIEINPLYTNGYLSFNASYFEFLTKKEEYVQAQMNLQKTLSNKAKREIEWLRAGVKARTTKSSARMKEAYQLIDHLGEVKTRNFSGQKATRLEIDATQRKTKKLLDIKKLCVGYEDKVLVRDLDLVLGPKYCLGIIGQNGSGKTTFLKTLQNPERALSGTINTAEQLRIVYFDQKRETLPKEQNLMQFLGEGTDQVVFKEKSMHVASYAARFLFTSEKMNMKIEHLSGGEQARLLIAKLFLNPADILILDEPTNDLDIDTIEVIENTLNEFEGLVILVSHDRKFMEDLCSSYLVLEGQGHWATYAHLDQWLKSEFGKTSSSDNGNIQTGQNSRNQSQTNFSSSDKSTQDLLNSENLSDSSKKLKLSYKEKKALETIDADIAKAEAQLVQSNLDLEAFHDFQNKEVLSQKISAVTKAQAEVDRLLALWEDLESRK
jgi:ATP-binding cassette subfamily F protein uup